MAFTFPLETADFMDILPVRSMTFDLPESVEISETEGGEVLTADFGNRLWQGEIELDDMLPDEADIVLSRLDVLRRGEASFMVYDLRRPGPRNPVAGLETVTLRLVHSNRRDIALGGVPSGWDIVPHDYLAFTYGSDPIRYALHRVVGRARGGSTNQTPYFEVSPPLRPGWALATPVTFVRAACKAKIVPNSVNAGKTRKRMVTGVSFRFIQTLR